MPIPAALLLGQLPATAGDKWLGLGIDPANPPAKGRVAFACLTQGDPTTQNSYAGLLIDEWPERIPSSQENAAVAFHYEEPKARAPQALLLAVCPDNRAFWDDDLITGILQETLELAKIRAVDLDSVAQVGQILPALYFALNLQGATISTNFATSSRSSHVSLQSFVSAVLKFPSITTWTRLEPLPREGSMARSFRRRYAIRCGF